MRTLSLYRVASVCLGMGTVISLSPNATAAVGNVAHTTHKAEPAVIGLIENTAPASPGLMETAAIASDKNLISPHRASTASSQRSTASVLAQAQPEFSALTPAAPLQSASPLTPEMAEPEYSDRALAASGIETLSSEETSNALAAVEADGLAEEATKRVADEAVPVAQALPELEPAQANPIDGNLEPEIVPIEGDLLPNQPSIAEPGDAPEALYADPNPLLYPTRVDEVEIIGTQPLTLEQAIELAYRNNEDLQIAILELERSQAALREAQAALYPTVSANGDLTSRQATTTSLGSGGIITGGGTQFSTQEELQTTIAGSLDLNYNLYTSGRRAASIRAAEEQLRFNQLEVERRRAELRLNTTNEYYDVQEADEQIRINQSFLNEAEQNLQDTQLREEVGVGTRFDVLTAEVQVANARQSLVQSLSQKQIAQRQLARRLNLPPVIEVDSVPPELANAWPLSLEESIILAFQNRAELEQQLTQREISEQQRRIALANLGPQVSLFANYNVQNNLDDSDGFEDTYSLGARVSINLFEGGQAVAQAAQRERDIEIAETRFSETRNLIRFQVEQAYANLEANLSNIRTAELAVDQATEALELARLRFNAGVGTQLEVTSAQSDLTEAQGNLVTAVLGYNRALASLERAVTNLPESTSPEALF
ncbi:TolC family protein [Almyronema epifaneia]|uniref:TolC family protein n=1 Tax=Almyronema epifaneia S1 TaxID=2991925 RepID=A0ABW6IEC6_9CYAN